MANVSILFSARPIGQIGSIKLDAVISESHGLSGQPTRHPVEQGAQITDHYIQNPDSLTLEGVISDTPVRLFGNIAEGQLAGTLGDLNDVIQEVNFAVTGEPDKQHSRSVAGYRALRALKRTGTPFTVVTGLHVYDNMLFDDIRVNRSASTGRSIAISAQMSQVQIVSSQFLDTPREIIAEAQKDSAQGEEQLGRQGPEELSDDEDVIQTDLFLRLFGG